jgi:exosortase sorting signal-containing protein
MKFLTRGFVPFKVFAALCVTGLPLLASAQTTELLTNGTFTGGLVGWNFGASTTGSANGTCGFNGSGVPGTETLTSLPGFTNAAGGPEQALGSVSLTANGFRSCVLYQDIAIPVGATTLAISGDFAIKTYGGLATGDTAIFVGLYPTSDVPQYQAAFLGGNRLIVPGANNVALAPRTAVTLNVSAYAGTTVRFAIIDAIQSQASGTGAFVPGGGSVVGADRVSALVTVPAVLTAQTITFANPGQQTLGTNPTLTATASSGLTPVFTSATPGVCTITAGGTLTPTVAGNCTVNVNQPGDGTFSAAPQVSQTFAVVAAAVVVAPASVPTLETWALVLLGLMVAGITWTRLKKH